MTTTQERAADIHDKLYPFQRVGVKFLDKRRRCLLADQMGCGKTVQTLAWLYIRHKLRPVTIICPSTAKLVWEDEAAIWTPGDRVSVLEGRTVDEAALDADIRIVNYDILPQWQKHLRRNEVVVIDECQYMRNRKAKRTRACLRLGNDAPNVATLSGTPIVKRPFEFYNVLSMLDSVTFPSFWDFAQRYCKPRHTRWGWNFDGADNIEELHELVSGRLMLRRLKKDVVKDLPPKRRCVVPVAIKNKAEYRRAERDYGRWLATLPPSKRRLTITSPSPSARAEALRQLVLKSKFDACCEWIEGVLDDDEKLVVFTLHTWAVDALKRRFKRACVTLDGRTSKQDRRRNIKAFQSNPTTRLFVGNLDAAGDSITLTAASNVAFLEFRQTPGTFLQAEDRVHRIGQTKEVTCWYLVAHDTHEEHTLAVLEEQRAVVETILNGGATEDENLADVLDAMLSYF